MLRNYLIVLIIFSITIFTCNKLLKEPAKSDGSEIYNQEYNLNTHDGDSLSWDHHYKKLTEYFKTPAFADLPTGFRYRPDETIKKYYEQYLKYENENIIDIGNLGLGMYHLHNGSENVAIDCFEKIKNTKYKGLNYQKGLCYAKMKKGTASITCFKSEIIINDLNNDAKIELINIAGKMNNWEVVKEYFPSLKDKTGIENSVAENYYFLSGNWSDYFKIILKSDYDYIIIFSSLLLSLIWIFYFIYLKQENNNILPVVLTFVLSCLLSQMCLILYDFFELYLHFEFYGSSLHQFLYCVFGIGLIEETIKVIPFLICLFIFRKKLEPIDYIILCCASALGFAFRENMIYINKYGSDIMHARGLLPTVSHMIDATLVGYGFIKAKTGKAYYIPLYFLLALLSHGLYDFWLMNDNKSFTFLLTFIFFFITAIYFFGMINNALNISKGAERLIGRSGKYQQYLLFSLSAAFLIEYIIETFTNGPTEGNFLLIDKGPFVFFFVSFLSTNLGSYNIIRNYWIDLDFNYLFQFKKQAPIDAIAEIKKGKDTILNIYPYKIKVLEQVSVNDEVNYFLAESLNETKNLLIIKPVRLNLFLGKNKCVIVIYEILNTEKLKGNALSSFDIHRIDSAIANFE